MVAGCLRYAVALPQLRCIYHCATVLMMLGCLPLWCFIASVMRGYHYQPWGRMFAIIAEGWLAGLLHKGLLLTIHKGLLLTIVWELVVRHGLITCRHCAFVYVGVYCAFVHVGVYGYMCVLIYVCIYVYIYACRLSLLRSGIATGGVHLPLLHSIVCYAACCCCAYCQCCTVLSLSARGCCLFCLKVCWPACLQGDACESLREGWLACLLYNVFLPFTCRHCVHVYICLPAVSAMLWHCHSWGALAAVVRYC